ncbi:MAG: xanthine dehydrogenase family protein subunit M [Acidobacteria bacterium]|nr:xanthine dehydrogenase family protein subunit M [Acidobacteriota bacterium]
MQWFDYARPRTLDEAAKLLAEHGEKVRILAGGTDILVQLRAGARAAEMVVDVKEIPELNEIRWDVAAGLTLGAAVPCYRIYGNADVKRHYPGIIDVASLIGGTQIQGRASLGGNLCNSAPSADSIPVMIVLDATCRIIGPSGERTVAVEDFCTAPGRNILQAGEILVSIHFPAPKPNSGAHYMRFIPRNEMDIAVAGAGVAVVLENGNFVSARVALASVAPTPLFVKEAGEALAGQPVNDESIARAAAIAKQAAKPIDDMRGTVRYRKHLCEVLTRRALQVAVQRAKGSN